MILLDKDKYEILKEPLKSVTINNLFASSVVEKKVDGLIYVDDENAPTTFYVIHPYGMSLLFGNSNNEEFNKKFRDYALNISKSRTKQEWMQASPDSWTPVLRTLFNGNMVLSSDSGDEKRNEKIELNSRVNFIFNLTRYESLKQRDKTTLEIVRTTREIFTNMQGSVVPANFWNNADDFLNNGIGFSVFVDGKLASTAYTSFIIGQQLELGIETVEAFRGKGLAWFACAALIDYCIAHNYEPVWACRLENIGSYKLAQSLGFDEQLRLPYYKLANN